MRLYIIAPFLLLFLLGCSSCLDVSKSFQYKCIPMSGSVSMSTGKTMLSLKGMALDSPERVTTAWELGSKIHLHDRFNELGAKGYRYVGLGMLDPDYNAIWICFEKLVNE